MRWMEIHLKADLHETTKSRVTVRYDLRACPVSVIAQDQMFLLRLLDWKKVQLAWTFFSVAGEWWRESKQRISAKKEKNRN